MTSETRESALLGGQPIKLFRITRGAVHWFHTNADRAIVLNGDTFTPAAIGHDKIQDGGDTQQRTLKITMPADLPVAANWRPFPSADPIGITIWTQHYGEADYLVDWIGRLIGPQFSDTTLTLSSEPTQTQNKKSGAGPIWQRPCWKVLGSEDCGVDLGLHAIPGTLTDVNGLTLTAAEFLAFPSGRLAGGWIEWTRADGLTDRRSINGHAGDTIVIEYGAEDLAIGLALDGIAPGCGGNWDDCVYFDNTDNHGGEEWIPGRDYYDGNPVR